MLICLSSSVRYLDEFTRSMSCLIFMLYSQSHILLLSRYCMSSLEAIVDDQIANLFHYRMVSDWTGKIRNGRRRSSRNVYGLHLWVIMSIPKFEEVNDSLNSTISEFTSMPSHSKLTYNEVRQRPRMEKRLPTKSSSLVDPWLRQTPDSFWRLLKLL